MSKEKEIEDFMQMLRDILGESGGCGSSQTGSWPGSLTLKCRKCGAAESCNDVF